MTLSCARTVRLAFVVAVLAGCGPGGAGFAVAVGSRGSLPTWQGSCRTETARGDALAIDGMAFEARAVGRTTVTCARGELYIDVLEVDRLEIEGPDTVGGSSVYFHARAFGDGRELDLGDSASVAWELDPTLLRDGACTDILGTCAGPDSIRVHTTATGRARIIASFAGKRASREVILEGPR